MMKTILFAVGMTFFQIAWADLSSAPTAEEIGNFHQTDTSVFRGARPSQEGISWLAQNQIKTDIDLEDDSAAVAQEQAWAQAAGIQFVSFPMSSYLTPKDQTVAQILQLMVSPQALPVFVHCHHGEDRTGLIMGLYRVKVQNWTPEAAYEEMQADGMTFTARLALLPYFTKVTGFNPGL